MAVFLFALSIFWGSDHYCGANVPNIEFENYVVIFKKGWEEFKAKETNSGQLYNWTFLKTI